MASIDLILLILAFITLSQLYLRLFRIFIDQIERKMSVMFYLASTMQQLDAINRPAAEQLFQQQVLLLQPFDLGL